MSIDPEALYACAAGQHGHFTREQALGHGLGVDAIRHRLARGVWVEAQPKVYRHAAVEPTLPGRCWAATARNQAVASHATAAAIHGLDRVADASTTHVTVAGASVPRLRDVVVHRTATLPRADWLRLDGVPVTSLPRTVIDAAPRSWHETAALVDDAVRRHRRARPWFAATASRLAARSLAARWVMELTRPEAEGEFWSWLERTAHGRFREGGLPAPEWNVALYERGRSLGIADAVWRPHRVIADLMGLRFHSSTAQRRRDAWHHRQWQAAGYLVLPFTYLDIVETPALMVTELRRALTAARTAAAPAPASPCRIPWLEGASLRHGEA